MTTEEALSDELDSSKVAFVYDDGEVLKGVTYMDISTDSQGKRVHLFLLVHSDLWWSGIGEQLWDSIRPYIENENASRVSIALPLHHSESRFLIKSLGFKHFYFNLKLVYDGGILEEPEIEVRPYQDENFEDYLRIVNEGFYELRRENDIKPYLPYSEEDFRDEKLRKKILDGSKGLYCFMDCGVVVGFGMVSYCIDLAVVGIGHQGKGYGRKIVECCTNRLLEEGISPVSLYVLDSNVGARRLYEKIGFRVKEVVELLWKYNDDKQIQK